MTQYSDSDTEEIDAEELFESDFKRNFLSLLEYCIDKNTYQYNTIHNISHNITINIALSGGIDSIVLLDLMYHFKQNTLNNNIKYNSNNIDIKAIYINHGLHKKSNAWGRFCKKICQHKNIDFQQIDIDIVDKTRNIEEQARILRYQALSSKLDHHDVLVTAHHLDDQVETFFLNLMRGSGLDGLSCMQQIQPLSSLFPSHCSATDLAKPEIYLLRPLLIYSKQQIEQYAFAKDLQWIDDDSNTNLRFDRNYIRHEFIPSLEHRFQNSVARINKSINNIQHNKQVINLFCSSILKDLQSLPQPSFSLIRGSCDYLSLTELKKTLHSIQLLELIIFWLKNNNLFNNININSNQLSLIKQFLDNYYQSHSTSTLQGFKLSLGNTWLVINIYNNQIFMCIISSDLYLKYLNFNRRKDNLKIEKVILTVEDLHHPFRYDGLVCHAKFLKNQSYSLNSKYIDRISFQPRMGGERYFAKSGNKKKLKQLWQESDICAWEKAILPLVYFDDELVYVPGIEINHYMRDSINHICQSELMVENGLSFEFSYHSKNSS